MIAVRSDPPALADVIKNYVATGLRSIVCTGRARLRNQGIFDFEFVATVAKPHHWQPRMVCNARIQATPCDVRCNSAANEERSSPVRQAHDPIGHIVSMANAHANARQRNDCYIWSNADWGD